MSVLLGSKLRRKILVYTFSHPDESYYVRELACIMNKDAGSISRELRKMEGEGLYKSVLKGSMKFYSLNKNYSLYNEIKQIVFKTEGFYEALKSITLNYKGISLAFIYGSFAQNSVKNTSDIDLIVVGKFAENKFMHDVRNLEDKLNREINYTVYSKEEYKKEKEKKGGFLNMVLRDKIIVIKGDIK